MSSLAMIVSIVAASLVALAAIVVLGVVLWRRTVRRYLIGLIGRREAVLAGLAALEKGVADLAAMDDGAMIAFALDENAEERRALDEVAHRMHIAAEELATMALPEVLIDAANDLSDAAELLWEQAEAIAHGNGVAVLDAIAAIDLESVTRFLVSADRRIAALCERYKVDDPSVYGGGLYI